MSTSRSRLTRSIQEIAKQDPDLRRAIEATKPRGDQPSAAGVGTSDAERDRICCDGSVSEEENPGTETRDTSEGGQDAGDGLNADDPADIGDMGPGSLTGLHDCATGTPIAFEGSGFLPPDGWDAPDSAPIEPTWVEGFYFRVNTGLTGYEYPGDYPRQSAERWCADSGGFCKSIVTCYQDQSELDYYCDYINANDVTTSIQVDASTCSNAPYDCADDPPRAQQWPTDGRVNLAIKNGSIVGSKYDPENDGTYSKPMSEIELCDNFGNSFYLSPSADGGWKTINATKDAGYLWGSNGQKIAHIDGNEYSDPSM